MRQPANPTIKYGRLRTELLDYPAQMRGGAFTILLDGKFRKGETLEDAMRKDASKYIEPPKS